MKIKSIFLIVFLLILSPIAFSQSKDTGAIVGTIVDEEKNPLPGATVTVTSPQLMGSRTFITDANGSYRFPALPPGDYTLKAELKGFKTFVQENIHLTTTVRLTIDLIMALSTLAEEITVVAVSPTVDVKSTETVSVTLTNEILRNIPYSQFTSDIVNLAPGVNDDDVAYGAQAGTGIAYSMDGVNVADPEGGTAWVFLDHNIIEEAKVMGVGLPAEYGNFTGVIFNLITKSGGNTFSGHMEFIFQGRKDDWPKGLWQTTNNSAYLQDFPEFTSPLQKLLDANAHLGGPIKKDKLWFFAGIQYYRSWRYPTGFPEPLDYKQPRGFLKLTSQISPKTNINASIEIDTYDGINRGGSATTSPEATVTQKSPEIVLNFSLVHTLSPNTFFDLKAAYFWGYYYLEPETGRDINAHFNLNDNMLYKSSGYYYLADRSRLQANASITHYTENFIKGKHDFKFGAEFEHSWSRSRYGFTGKNFMYYVDYWGYGYTGNYLAYQYQGYDSDSNYNRAEAFAQDSWQITNRLNINLGARFSQNWGFIEGMSGAVYKTSRIAPRIGFIYDIFGNKKTVFKAHYGQFTEGMFAAYHMRLSPNYYDYISYYWDLDLEKWVEYRRTKHGKWVIQDGIKHPYMNQFTLSLEREMFKDTSFSISYIRRDWKNIIGVVDTLATYAPRTINVLQPDGSTKPQTIYTLTSGDAHQFEIKNFKKEGNVMGDPYRRYEGVEFLFNKRFSNKWQLLLSYVYSKTKGTIDNTWGDDIGWNARAGLEVGDPNYWINADGPSTYDNTHMLKVQGTYIFPLDISFSTYFRAISGNTWTMRYRTSRYAQGRVTFFAEPRGAHHYPTDYALDVRLEKIFTLAEKYRLGIIVDVFNVFNTDTITSWGTRIGYDWLLSTNPDYYQSTDGHDLYGIVRPRQARIGIRLIF